MSGRNIDSVRSRIAQAAARRGVEPSAIRLVSVSKNVSIDQIEEVLALGVRDIGENRVQEALSKYMVIGDRAIWHLIGHLQTNKVKDALKVFSLIHSVDSDRLAKEIDREAARISKVQDILVEVNISGEEGRYGIRLEGVSDFLTKLSFYPNIHILGLMGMAPLVDNPESARPYFKTLKHIFDEAGKKVKNIDMRYLSMGMSQDFEVAIEEGSNMVRIGTAIFKG